jgi:hypothetical protein
MVQLDGWELMCFFGIGDLDIGFEYEGYNFNNRLSCGGSHSGASFAPEI